MAKKRKSKAPFLRKGLTVDELLAGTWMISETRYTSEGEIDHLTIKILRAACQGIIDEVDSGKRVTRRAVINTFCRIGDMLITAKDHITQKMGEGKLTPTLLDKIANA